jgi:hypothetical protein
MVMNSSPPMVTPCATMAGRHIAHAHRANDDAFFAGDRVNFVPELLNPRLGGGNLFLRGMQSH